MKFNIILFYVFFSFAIPFKLNMQHLFFLFILVTLINENDSKLSIYEPKSIISYCFNEIEISNDILMNCLLVKFHRNL